MSVRPHGFRLLAAESAIVLAIILNLGLWPFHAPRNDVKWLKNGLLFNRYGTVFSLSSMPLSKVTDRGARTIEVWARAEPWHSGSLLSFYNRETSQAVSLRQSVTDFELMEYNPKSQFRKRSRVYASDVFRRRQLKFIAVSSGNGVIKVYVNGVLAAQARLRIEEAALNGWLIAGDAPAHTDTWRGEIRGIALYDAELSQSRIVKHYQTWKGGARPTISPEDNVSHLYLMDEHGGSTIHDTVTSPIHMVIPEHYTVLDKIALEPMWNEFEISRSFAASTLKNIIGFVPLGVCFYLFSFVCEWKRPLSKIVLAGLAVSFTIEVLQIFLPTRDSGTTDLVTNTVGTWFGILVCQWIGPSRIVGYLPNGNFFRRTSTRHAKHNGAVTCADRNK